jgi:hypothetical protein
MLGTHIEVILIVTGALTAGRSFSSWLPDLRSG